MVTNSVTQRETITIAKDAIFPVKPVRDKEKLQKISDLKETSNFALLVLLISRTSLETKRSV